MEADYLSGALSGFQNVLSIGCGTGDIEGMLVKRGFRVTGLDRSATSIRQAPGTIAKVIGDAAALPFTEGGFDAVIFVASMQFIEDFRAALTESADVLGVGGRFVLMLLNPRSEFFRERFRRSDSHFRRIVHVEPEPIVRYAERLFTIRTGHLLGIVGEQVEMQTDSPDSAALLVVSGEKK